MSELIIDYCVGSFERRPDLGRRPQKPSTDVGENRKLVKDEIRDELSISQIYSNHMNRIVTQAHLTLYC